MASEPENNVIDSWLGEAMEATPDCEVLAAVMVATRSMQLDEGLLLAKLRRLCEPPKPDDNELG
jgi:hypothetical protein